MHISDPKKKNPPKGHKDHDALFLVRPMIEMMQRKFATNYHPHTQISLNESTMPFKGRVGFKCYNPKKPNRVHIKMFMVSEAETGYICGFEVYTGKDSKHDAECTKTTSTVMDLLDSIKLLDKGHHVYFDNYYNSPELIEKLLERKTHGCGTVRKDHCQGLPKAVSKAKLTKRGQTVFHRKGNLLALKWKDKRDVYILTGIHKADSVVSLKRTYKGEKIRKPEAVFIYNQYMSSVDLTDQFLSSYSFLRRSVKWSKKFFIHCINMVMLNAYMLYKHYAKEKKTHKQFHLDIVKHLLKNAKETPRGALEIPEPANSPLRLIERHFIEKIPPHAGCKRTHPSCKCYVCNSVT